MNDVQREVGWQVRAWCSMVADLDEYSFRIDESEGSVEVHFRGELDSQQVDALAAHLRKRCDCLKGIEGTARSDEPPWRIRFGP